MPALSSLLFTDQSALAEKKLGLDSVQKAQSGWAAEKREIASDSAK